MQPSSLQMNTEMARELMISQQLRTCGIVDEGVLQAVRSIPRDVFVPDPYAAFAFSDFRIPLFHDQTMMTPLEEASILQALQLQKTHKVLEIGTGSGYLTALMATQAAHVYSVEYYKELIPCACSKLERYAINNVTIISGDGVLGLPEYAPYDVIVVTGALETLSPLFRPQLMKGGKLFAIIGKPPLMEACLYTLDQKDGWHAHALFETSIEPLVQQTQKVSFNF